MPPLSEGTRASAVLGGSGKHLPLVNQRQAYASDQVLSERQPAWQYDSRARGPYYFLKFCFMKRRISQLCLGIACSLSRQGCRTQPSSAARARLPHRLQVHSAKRRRGTIRPTETTNHPLGKRFLWMGRNRTQLLQLHSPTKC